MRLRRAICYKGGTRCLCYMRDERMREAAYCARGKVTKDTLRSTAANRRTWMTLVALRVLGAFGGALLVFTSGPAGAATTFTVTTHGYTQRGAMENTLEEDTGALLKVELDAAVSTVKGLVINRFGDDGILLNGGTGNSIEGNFIGTSVAGTADRGNGDSGVSITGDSNTVGGAQPAQRNLLSGNGDAGVLINDSGSTGNSILSNSTSDNDGLGIELAFGSDVTPNDPDTGPNDLQNHPP